MAKRSYDGLSNDQLRALLEQRQEGDYRFISRARLIKKLKQHDRKG